MATRTKLTEREKRFAEMWVEHGNGPRAHREAGFLPGGSDDSHKRRAWELLRRPLVADYVAQLQAQHARDNRVRAEDLLKQLDAAYVLAMREKRPSAMVTAVMGKARITGLDKQIVEHHMARPIELVINRPGSGA